MDDTVTREFEKAWNILKQGLQPSQRATDAMAMFQQVQDAKRKRMAMNPQPGQGQPAAPAQQQWGQNPAAQPMGRPMGQPSQPQQNPMGQQQQQGVYPGHDTSGWNADPMTGKTWVQPQQQQQQPNPAAQQQTQQQNPQQQQRCPTCGR